MPIIPKTKVSDTYDGLIDRSTLFLDELIAKLNKDSPDVETIFIVTHAATKIAMGRVLLREPDVEIRTGVCSLDTYVYENGVWVAKSIGDTHYLTDGEEMHWGFGKFYFDFDFWVLVY